MYNPLTGPITTVIRVKTRSETDVNGAKKYAYADADPALDVCQWKSKGGTENNSAGVFSYTDTAEVVMWYRNDITIHSRLLLEDDATQAYEIISPPENIEMRGQYLMFKVQRVGGA